MPSTTFNLAALLDGDAEQLQSLFATAALTIVPPAGLEACTDWAQVEPLLRSRANPGEPLSKQLPAIFSSQQLALAPPLLLRLMLADKIFHTLLGEAHIDPALRQLFSQLAIPVIQAMAKDDSVYSNALHPLRQLLGELGARGHTWYPRDAKPQQQLFNKLNEVVDAIQQDSTGDGVLKALHPFRQWAEGEDKRARLLETRLCETEVAHLRLLAAECKVLDLLNQALAGKTFPITLIDQLPALKSTLQHCLINDGADAPFWKAWQRCLPLFGTVFVTGEELDEQQLYRDIPLLLTELERNLHRPQAGDQFQDFIDTLAQHLMLAIQKKSLECSKVSAFAYPDGHTDSHTHVTSAILQQAQAIEPGDWILLNDDGAHLLRCKLALKLPDVDQLLFVDSSGRKVMAKSVKDFSLCLSTGVARWLKQISLDEVITSALNYLIALGDKHAEQYRAELEQQQAQEAAAKQAAAEKALAEAHALAAKKQQRELVAKAAETRRQQHEIATLAAEKQAQEQATLTLVDTLNVGAWIEISAPDKPATRCKLSVIISSTGKYIFVDQVGRKAADLQREQLIAGINAGQIHVISKGDKFEDQLVKVIRGLRKDIS